MGTHSGPILARARHLFFRRATHIGWPRRLICRPLIEPESGNASGIPANSVISDFVLEADKTAPRFGALFALNMLVNTRGGSSYSEPEYDAWLKQAGFAETRRVRMPGPAGLMIATK
jgi:hypothetical protein